jgi:hypothetical protein
MTCTRGDRAGGGRRPVQAAEWHAPQSVGEHPPQLLINVGGIVGYDPQRPLGTGGLGLPLTERLAQNVGWYPTATGKHVWAQFTILAS